MVSQKHKASEQAVNFSIKIKFPTICSSKFAHVKKEKVRVLGKNRA